MATHNSASAPRISCILPVYNGQDYLAEAIESILDQTFGDFELLIIDDGSGDASRAIALSYRDPRIQLIKLERNSGVSVACNRGLDLARGEYVARMDADDVSLPERFARQIAYLDEHRDVAVLGTGHIRFGAGFPDQPAPKKTTDHGSLHALLFWGCPIVHPSVMVRRSALENPCLRYDPALSGTEDYALWLQLANRVKLANLAQPLLRYRLHAQAVSQQPDGPARQKARGIRRRLCAELVGPVDEATFAINDAMAWSRPLPGLPAQSVLEHMSQLVHANNARGLYPKRLFAEQTALRAAHLLQISGHKLRVSRADGNWTFTLDPT